MTDLAARYGRTPERRRRDRAIGIAAAVGVVLVMLAWVIWGGLADDRGTIDTQDTGSTRIDEHRIQIDFSVTVEPGTPVRCAVNAFDRIHATVGWVELDVGPSDRWTTAHSVEVRTSDEAMGGLVYRCWLR
jgi:hypothetical protein